MKQRAIVPALLAVAVLLAACGGAAATPTPTLRLVSSAFGGFQVLSPADLPETVEIVQTDIGDLEVHTFKGASGEFAYTVVYADYPARYAAVDPAPFLSAVRDDQVVGMGGTLLMEGNLSLGGFAGREFQIRAKAEGDKTVVFRTRAYWVPTRLYQVSVLVPYGQADDPAVVAFLDSFRVTDRAY